MSSYQRQSDARWGKIYLLAAGFFLAVTWSLGSWGGEALKPLVVFFTMITTFLLLWTGIFFLKSRL